jgi:hypothetical protein
VLGPFFIEVRMPFQKLHYTCKTSKADPEKPDAGVVRLDVNYKGTLENRGDALVLVLDAWIDAVMREGYDPVEAFKKVATKKGILESTH